MDLGTASDVKEQIRQATDIVDLVGGYLPLRRQGRNYVAQCPWHDDTRPSLQVNPERQTFKCWVCDVGGDVYSFLMRMERFEFREALEMLAERTGVSLGPSGPKAEAGSPGDSRTQFAASAWAAEQFQRCLTESTEGQAALRYLDDRGINDEMRVRFQIGFSPPDWEWLVRQSHKGPFSAEVLERVGLVGRREGGGGYYDRFRGRLIFPIRDVRGRPIAFGGRVLPELADDRSAKYVNSPETPLYSKSDQLYALDHARDAIAQEKQVVVMEGYTDVIMAHQHGVTNAVACCGTALGERHLRLLRRFTDKVVLVLDGDDAGQRRTNEVLELFVSNQLDLRILTLPEGLDPCDYLLQNGSEAWEAFVATAADALEYKFRYIEKRVGRNPSTHEAAQSVEELLATLAKVNVRAGEASSIALLREQQMLGRIAHKFHLLEEELRARLKVLRRGSLRLIGGTTAVWGGKTNEETPTPPLQDTKSAAPAVLSLWEKEIFELVLSKPELVGPIIQSIPIAAMQSAPATWLYGLCQKMHGSHEAVTFDRLLASAQSEKGQKLLIDLEEDAERKQESDHDQRLLDLVEGYRKQHEQADQHQHLADLREGQLAPDQEEEVLNKFFDNLKRRQAGSLSTDG